MSALIRSIALKNFKGFSEEVRVEIRPITLLFGANSAGKSSVHEAARERGGCTKLALRWCYRDICWG